MSKLHNTLLVTLNMFIYQEWNTLSAVKKGSYENKFQQQMKDYTKALNMLTGFSHCNHCTAVSSNILYDIFVYVSNRMFARIESTLTARLK